MARYVNNIKIEKTDEGKQYYTTAIPADPIQQNIEYKYTARLGDRWDTIAYKYLGSATLWYEVANANDAINGSIFIKPGTIITIPQI